MADVHTLSAGLKAYTTSYTNTAIGWVTWRAWLDGEGPLVGSLAAPPACHVVPLACRLGSLCRPRFALPPCPPAASAGSAAAGTGMRRSTGLGRCAPTTASGAGRDSHRAILHARLPSRAIPLCLPPLLLAGTFALASAFVQSSAPPPPPSALLLQTSSRRLRATTRCCCSR